MKTMEKHGWSSYYDIDIMDSEGPDMVLDIPNGRCIQKNYVGKHLADYDSMLVLSHFKGHPMGGYGGALKQLAIGVASSYGKAYIHGVGKTEEFWTYAATDDPGQAHLLERIESRNGIHTIEAAAELGFGSREYELVEV